MKIKPIRTAKDYKAALARVEKLMSAKKKSPEGDELDIIATLVEAWEEKHFPIGKPDPVAAIEHRMESLGLTRKDLVPILGSKSRVSEILNRKRKITMEMARNLHAKMGIPAEMLIKDYEVR
ncbi:MAG: hypothetical protein EPN97_09410 [Alphaproteobacteria bacterium]|nr:MAG: hypothetical protein EPN97_09410 [Alphaproteobacteria bacterium]